ncbi:hypothetical protein H4R18_001872 [Coemansia javaensis]|uniref:Nudix hydrolase domain-containing protein n=1 Tax=Coemansia javaensis TaxID=2761396 RepID=A0A9W8LKQ3_9FUNG|nr:hypothetical protein H4R18_001872 [Coemansia javaensis]
MAAEIPHARCVAQLARHLAALPAARAEHGRRGAVAIVVRLALPGGPALDGLQGAALVQALDAQLAQAEAARERAQVLFIQRARYPGDPWSGHIGFPGGKREPGDGSDRATAERETLEELGVGLRDARAFAYLGSLDDVRAATLLRGPLMVVSPHVYLLHTPAAAPALRPSPEVAAARWIDFAELLRRVDRPAAAHRCISFDVAARTAPRAARARPLWFRALAGVLGRIHYPMLPLRFAGNDDDDNNNNSNSGPDPDPSPPASDHVLFASSTELFLWGISLEMARELVDLCLPAAPRELRPGYTSITGSWPQMDRARWPDVNLVVNAVWRLVWRPARRKPWRTRHALSPDYFETYFGLLRVLFPLACLARASLLYTLARAAAGLAGRLKHTRHT